MKESFYNCLFRYRKLNNNAESNIDALRKDRLYFSIPANFNDPYDNRMYVDKAAIEKVIRKNWEHMDEFLDILEKQNLIVAQYGRTIWHSNKKLNFQNEFLSMVDKIIDTVRDNYRNYMKIICFSEEYDSELMWSHYAEDHKGFLIVYEKENIEHGEIYNKYNEKITKKVKLLNIQYTNTQVNMTKYMNDFLLKRLLSPNMDTSFIPEIPNQALRDMATTKSESWKYEKEWRVIPRVISIEKESPITYMEIKPKAIIAGTQCIDKNKKILKNIAMKKKIPFYEMQISSGIQYGLEIK